MKLDRLPRSPATDPMTSSAPARCFSRMAAAARHQATALVKLVWISFRDRAQIPLKVSLIAEEAVGEKQDVETSKLLNDLVELGPGVSSRAIERPWDRLRPRRAS